MDKKDVKAVVTLLVLAAGIWAVLLYFSYFSPADAASRVGRAQEKPEQAVSLKTRVKRLEARVKKLEKQQVVLTVRVAKLEDDLSKLRTLLCIKLPIC
jgi:predicted RNase H-like nuclease (RuvC/YqgF family)